ncbi:MAG TPA: 4Fe-4S binding protein [Firmicutes bacterium]|jgi:aryl-alcohol dehydrogenase-like predicted oxidoreductase/NAD-dependent dihydropyrimidine dehydrogenase PreA subunit|nr:4Fe-4S binding protein [Bacillota bacterium]
MKKRKLGQTGFWVSPLCYGTLTIGPRQKNLSLAEGEALIRYALELGINFFDSAEIYGTYPYLGRALRGRQADVVVVAKSYAVTAEEMKRSVEKARQELEMERIPLFLLHEQESAATLRGHRGALEYLVGAKEKGLVGAVGLSTHTVAGVRAGASCPEIEVIHPLYNMRGWGIRDGGPEEMAEAIALAVAMGKGVYIMKALAGGHLSREAEKALRFALDLPGISAVAVGMQSKEEIDFNYRIVGGESPISALREKVGGQPRRLFIESWCTGCGRCVKRCPFGALRLSGGKARVDFGACMACGYCSEACEILAIKIL